MRGYVRIPPSNRLRQRLEMGSKEGGVTIIEILVVTVIVGLMGQMAVTNLIGQMPGKRLQGASNQLVWDLMAARMKAIMQNHDIKVTFPNHQSYTIWEDADDDDVVDDGEWIAKTSNLHQEYHGVSFATPLPTTFAFSSRGTSTVAQNIDLGNKSGAIRITVARNGKAAIHKTP